MELQVVTFEQAKSLKELGFNYKCQGYYDLVGTLHPYESAIHWNHNANTEHRSCYSAPTLELVAKWLRDKKNISIVLRRLFGKWAFMLEKLHNGGEMNLHAESTNIYTIYEEALSAGIDKAIEILKDNE